ncbi:MAG: hypothetical protein DMF61_20265 [Blastocatellia bacterium AA13]|nr:MAG: hypothetical protein DMF61_20265 [Blastocatellia bacterium AA13]
MIGRSIQHYLIAEQIGVGGMGEVYRAEDTRLGRKVALKFLPASYQYDADRRARFMREARAASALSSPNIAAIYDIGEHEGTNFIVMEYVEGDLLSFKIASGQLTVLQSVDICMQVADALHEAHSRGIVHRDVKSANIIVTDRGLAKVLDFGIAKISPIVAKNDNYDEDETEPLGQATIAGVVMGTVAYMSPEQALGRPVDHRTDIFSLGAVLYETLTSRLPFEGDSTTEIIDKIVHSEPPAVARFNYQAPKEVDRILRKGLEKNPNFRYQTVREMYIDLYNLRRDLEARERSGSSRPFGDDSGPTALLNGAEAETEPAERARLANAVAVLNFANITREPADEWIGSGIAETVTADLKNIRGISVIGSERVYEILNSLGRQRAVDADEKLAIEIGKRLGASWIVTGGYQRVAESIRITARIVVVGTGALIKTVKIDGKMSEIFELQDRIVFELTQGLHLEVGTSEISEIERRETKSVEAYENFSRGMIDVRRGSRASLDRAIEKFETATALDPGYALAWAALGAACDLKGSYLSIPELSYKAIDYEKKAIELNPKLSHAHLWLGSSYTGLGFYDAAVESIKEAIRLEPSNAQGHSALGRVYWLGKGMIDEGITEFEHAIALNPEAGYSFLQLGFLRTLKGDYERAEKVLRQAIELQEKYISGKEGLQIVGAHARLGYAYYRQARYQEAIEEYQKEVAFLSSSDHGLRERTLIELNQKIGAAFLRLGDNAEAERRFAAAISGFEERLAKGADDPFTKYYIAALYSLRNMPDPAVKYFEETLGLIGALNRTRARIDPDFDNIRKDARFIDVLNAPLAAGH